MSQEQDGHTPSNDRSRARRSASLAASTVAVLASLGLLAGALYSHQVTQLRQQLRVQGQLLARNFSRDAASALVQGDATRLEALAGRLLAQRGIVFVTVRGSEGTPIVSQGRGTSLTPVPAPGTATIVENPDAPEPYLLIVERIERPSHRAPAPEPLASVEAREPLGTLELGLSLGALQTAIKATRRVTLWTTAGAALLGVLLSLLVAQRSLRPLRELDGLAECMGGSELQDELPCPNDPAFASLVGGFNRMLGTVHRTRAEADGTRLNLETVFKERTHELRRSEQMYRSFIQEAQVAILVWGPHTLRIVEANAKAAELFGEDPANLVNRSLDELFARSDHRKYAEALRSISERGTVNLSDVELEARHRVSFPAEITSSLLQLEDEAFVLGLIRDLTETRASERRGVLMNEDISRRERMVSIGQLAAGVAHEINNPMSYVASNVNQLADHAKQLADLTAQTLAPGGALMRLGEINEIIAELQEMAADTCEGVGRVTEIVTALREFSHGGRAEVTYEWVDPNRVIQNCITLIGSEIKQHATVRLDLKPLPPTYCHATQIGQVLMNLIRNAAQAMEEPGEILIMSRAKDDLVHLVIEDNGRGIAADDLPKIFDPFFTTKAVGLGTGLGLSVSNEIIRKHGGSLWVDSRVDHGTRFVIELLRTGPSDDDTNAAESEAEPEAC